MMAAKYSLSVFTMLDSGNTKGNIKQIYIILHQKLFVSIPAVLK